MSLLEQASSDLFQTAQNSKKLGHLWSQYSIRTGFATENLLYTTVVLFPYTPPGRNNITEILHAFTDITSVRVNMKTEFSPLRTFTEWLLLIGLRAATTIHSVGFCNAVQSRSLSQLSSLAKPFILKFRSYDNAKHYICIYSGCYLMSSTTQYRKENPMKSNRQNVLLLRSALSYATTSKKVNFDLKRMWQKYLHYLNTSQ
jgi:hypothetical protein